MIDDWLVQAAWRTLWLDDDMSLSKADRPAGPGQGRRRRQPLEAAISERTKGGLLAARKRGRSPGRPPLHAYTVSALQELVDNGTSVTRTEEYDGIGRSTINRVIRQTSP